MRAFLIFSILVAIVLCSAVLFKPKELFCDNGQLSGNSNKYLKNESIVVLQYESGKIQAFKPSDCK